MGIALIELEPTPTLGAGSFTLNMNGLAPKAAQHPGEAQPDSYEQPFPSLDFNITQGLTENWKVTFRGKNMLNPFYRLTQTQNGVEYDTYTFTKGWDMSLNMSYSF
jgi:hypothetical protein